MLNLLDAAKAETSTNYLVACDRRFGCIGICLEEIRLTAFNPSMPTL
jgi:hypothetical protein